MNHLVKITALAKKLQKLHPKTKWTDLVKKAAKQLRGTAKAKVSGVKKPAAKKAPAKKKTTVKPQRRAIFGTRKPVVTPKGLRYSKEEKIKAANELLLMANKHEHQKRSVLRNVTYSNGVARWKGKDNDYTYFMRPMPM